MIALFFSLSLLQLIQGSSHSGGGYLPTKCVKGCERKKTTQNNKHRNSAHRVAGPHFRKAVKTETRVLGAMNFALVYRVFHVCRRRGFIPSPSLALVWVSRSRWVAVRVLFPEGGLHLVSSR